MRLCSGEPDGLSPKCCEAALLAWFQEGRAAFVLGDLQGKRTWRYRAQWFCARAVARVGLLHVGDGEICLVRTGAPCLQKKDA